MNYKIVTQKERDEMITSFLHQQEIDHLCHSINKERYENILNDKTIPDGEFKQRIQQLFNEVNIRLFEVEKIIEHTQSQISNNDNTTKEGT